jgi:hypothetical protein
MIVVGAVGTVMPQDRHLLTLQRIGDDDYRIKADVCYLCECADEDALPTVKARKTTFITQISDCVYPRIYSYFLSLSPFFQKFLYTLFESSGRRYSEIRSNTSVGS